MSKNLELDKFIMENPVYNKDLKENKKAVENFKKFNQCKKKTDLLYIHVTKGENIQKNSDLVILKPIFVDLNPFSINLQNGINTSSLFQSISLKNIQRISQQEQLEKFFCFDLVIDKIIKKEEENFVTLCAKNLKEKNDWINAIQVFKECQVTVQTVDHNDKLLYDFSKINNLLKNKDIDKIHKSIIKPEKAAQSLYYDNSNPTIVKSDETKSSEKKVHNIVNRIMETIESSRIRENQVKREMGNKLKEAKEFSKDISRKESMLINKVNNRLSEAKMQDLKLLNQKAKEQEMNLLKAVENKVNKMRNEDIKRIKKDYKKKIEYEHKGAEKQAQSMMNIIVDSKKLKQYNQCTDDRLLNFEEKSYIKESCNRMFGEFVKKFLS